MSNRIFLQIRTLFHLWWDLLPPSLRRFIKVGFSLFFLVLGVIGIFIPVMPQIPFLLLGLTLLSSESSHARNVLRRMKRWLAQQRRAFRRKKNKN